MNTEKVDPFDKANHEEFIQLKKRIESGEILHQLSLDRMERHPEGCPICQEAMNLDEKK